MSRGNTYVKTPCRTSEPLIPNIEPVSLHLSMRTNRSMRCWAIGSFRIISLFTLACLTARGADLNDSVITIFVTRASTGSAQGTGFVVGTGGRIVTAYHVVEGAR